MTSHATVRQAVILAGGQGTRLKPYTDTHPKAMIEIAGRCIIDHQIDWLAEAGVTNVVISAGHLHEVLIEHISASSQPVQVDTVVEDKSLGRGGGLKYAGKHLPAPSEAWFALNGDIWTRFDLGAMTAYSITSSGRRWPRSDWSGLGFRGGRSRSTNWAG